jgi:hypothetical protein
MSEIGIVKVLLAIGAALRESCTSAALMAGARRRTRKDVASEVLAAALVLDSLADIAQRFRKIT